jgi:hypothetical protein
MPILGILASSYNSTVPGSYESIATATGTGSSATITFTSIPTDYTHLQIRLIAKSTDTSSSVHDLLIRFNSDSGASAYTYHSLYASGGTYGDFTNTYDSANSSINIEGLIDSGAGLSSVMLASIIDILEYKSTSKRKVLRHFSGFVYDTSLSNVSFGSGLWDSTSAITSIDIISSTANFTTNSQFALYGIKA